MSSATLLDAGTDTGDRLTFTLFLALALHALLILGITFKVDPATKLPPTLEITLASHSSAKVPEEADYLAQFNQQASGTTDLSRQMTTDQLAPIEDSRIREVSPTPQVKAAQPVPEQQLQLVTTVGDSPYRLSQKALTPEKAEQQPGQDPLDTPLSSEIASLRAKLDEQRQAMARRPRVRTITSVAAKASADAEYLAKWTRKVEQVGNRNFPEEAIRKGIVGNLRLLTVLRPNGTIHSVEILHSSGYQVLDNAALQIVHLSSPFAPFPPEIRKTTDQLEIIRTWHFELTGLSTSAQNN
ncbi:energy transducer TonB [Pseudomaricurvus sp. HS19]|uniref:energy transducer TonB n=1 Tax=Pseudomaricurvus sp. HS19 TaxID=2692626 RepID=UPI00136C673F|nr:energy transducer TonB [Pseudomaricurvus sp. HS19]MYM63669.1 TonB family protein [Pseudomaricurvus sp. HS19]